MFGWLRKRRERLEREREARINASCARFEKHFAPMFGLDPLDQARDAVIEAARALAPKLCSLRPELLIPALEFRLAVEALERAEKTTK